jgi:hypothetical protein
MQHEEDGDVIICHPTEYQLKKSALLVGGLSQLQIVSDFDKTLYFFAFGAKYI